MSHQGPCDNERRSRWGETDFMLRQLCQAVGHPYPLAAVLREWAQISLALSETPRARSRQAIRIYDLLQRRN